MKTLFALFFFVLFCYSVIKIKEVDRKIEEEDKKGKEEETNACKHIC